MYQDIVERGPAIAPESEVFKILSRIDSQTCELFTKLNPILCAKLEKEQGVKQGSKTELLGRLENIANNLGELIERINL